MDVWSFPLYDDMNNAAVNIHFKWYFNYYDSHFILSFVAQIVKNKNYQLNFSKNLWMYFIESINIFKLKEKYQQSTHNE